MRKRTFIGLYSLVLLICGLLIFGLGSSFAGIEKFSELTGSAEIIFMIKLIGVGMGTAGFVGLMWSLALSENPELAGYAGLNGPGFFVLIIPLFLAGPFWLLVAWVLWLIPAFRASSTTLGG
jgi:hypothetical protein